MSNDTDETIEGPLEKLKVTRGEVVEYELLAGDKTLELNHLVGKGLEIRFLDQISCRNCETPSRKSYGGGYCYPCFKKLAQCDLCVMSPDRCHYAQGTCREPDWGDAFCMQPHLVYLANSSGAKVGITRLGYEIGRWMDQGATQALPILKTPTRHIAGLCEVALAQYLTDRTDWRALVSRDAPTVDLTELREKLRSQVADLPVESVWLNDVAEERFQYPVQSYARTLERLRLDDAGLIHAGLLGIKGQYLIFDTGVFNVRQHTSYHVSLRALKHPPKPESADQMELFS
ncbi:MAG: DUF2797 domain-containing protein [Gammaproteobacteria bacterium]|nr:DUF2797 domain-containing protein [Gammaproteobacteria bacterium]